MNRRGSMLLLLMVVVAVIAGGTILIGSRTRAEISRYQQDDLRLQALWLARSALDTGLRGTSTVSTALGSATVTVSGADPATRVVVELAGARAEVTTRPYAERFAPAPPGLGADRGSREAPQGRLDPKEGRLRP
jgi:hypothetical protein